jgi:DNA-binding response OmpR family regulator
MQKLLVVDDSEDLLFAMQTLLEQYDFEVRTATNEASFLKEATLFKPAIIIMDVLLNGENGRDICKSFRENPDNENVALILFSASANNLKNFEECGADGIIEKPFGIKELIKKIETILQFRKK